MELTELEKKMLRVIATDECTPLNGGEPRGYLDAYTWLDIGSFSHMIGVTTNQGKGVLGSLTKKGLVYINDPDTSEAAIGFTEEGFKAYTNS